MIESLLGKGLPTNLSQAIAKTRQNESPDKAASTLSKAANSLTDQVSISDETTQQLESLKNLNRQLSRFLDVLKGKESAKSVIAQLDREGLVLGKEVKSALSISETNFIKETTALSAEISEDGEIDVVLTNIKETLSQTNVSLGAQSQTYAGFLG